MADHTYITANCSFVTSFKSLFPYPASDVLGVIKNLKNGKNYEQFKTAVIKNNKDVAQVFVKELYEKSIIEIVGKFEGDRNVVVGLQELNNNYFAYGTINKKKPEGYFPVLGGFQTTGNLYPTLGYILPGDKEQYLQATNGIIKPTKEVSPDSVDPEDYSEGIMAVRDLGSDNKLTDSTDADIIVKNITFDKYGDLKEINDDGRPVSMVVKKRSKPEPESEPKKQLLPQFFNKKYKNNDSKEIASFIYINSHMLNPSLLKKVTQKQLNDLKLKGKKCIIKFLNENKASDTADNIADNIEDNELQVKVEEILRTEKETYYKMLKECAENYMSKIKTLLQQNDMDTWYTYCQKRFQECISDIVDKNFQNLIVDDDTVVVFFGDFNDPRTHLKNNKLSCIIKDITYEMDIIYNPNTTCCPNKNSVYTDNYDIKKVLVKSPYNKTFSFAMKDDNLDQMFKDHGNFDTPAFTGDYIGVGTNNKEKHFPGVSTDYFDGGSDHKFVKVIFSNTNIPEGGKRRRTRRKNKNKNKNAKKTNKKGKSKKYRKKGRKTRKIRRRK
jgi:hypothetical protein